MSSPRTPTTTSPSASRDHRTHAFASKRAVGDAATTATSIRMDAGASTPKRPTLKQETPTGAPSSRAQLDTWRFEQEFLPPLPHVSNEEHRAMNAAKVAFDSHICRQINTCSFGFTVNAGQSARQQLTPSKLYVWWAVKSLIALKCVKCAFPIDRLEGWIFMPSSRVSGCSGGPDMWQPLHFLPTCFGTGAQSTPRTSPSLRAQSTPHDDDRQPPLIPRVVNESALISHDTWRLGQLTRLALGSVGPCLRRARSMRLQQAQLLGTRRTNRTIAMHVRRGDSCQRWSTDRWDGGALRSCYPLSEYMDAARRLKSRYDASHILLATDSPRVIRELSRHTGEFSFSFLQMDRTGVGGVEGLNIGRPATSDGNGSRAAVFIEDRASEMGSDERELLLSTLLADVTLLQGADLFVGDYLSTITRLVLFAHVGRTGRMPPFALVGGSLQQGVWGNGVWPIQC